MGALPRARGSARSINCGSRRRSGRRSSGYMVKSLGVRDVRSVAAGGAGQEALALTHAGRGTAARSAACHVCGRVVGESRMAWALKIHSSIRAQGSGRIVSELKKMRKHSAPPAAIVEAVPDCGGRTCCRRTLCGSVQRGRVQSRQPKRAQASSSSLWMSAQRADSKESSASPARSCSSARASAARRCSPRVAAEPRN